MESDLWEGSTAGGGGQAKAMSLCHHGSAASAGVAVPIVIVSASAMAYAGHGVLLLRLFIAAITFLCCVMVLLGRAFWRGVRSVHAPFRASVGMLSAPALVAARGS
jgi:hypothetical protein